MMINWINNCTIEANLVWNEDTMVELYFSIQLEFHSSRKSVEKDLSNTTDKLSYIVFQLVAKYSQWFFIAFCQTCTSSILQRTSFLYGKDKSTSMNYSKTSLFIEHLCTFPQNYANLCYIFKLFLKVSYQLVDTLKGKCWYQRVNHTKN